MKPLVIYTKTFSRDLIRLKVLIESVKEYNEDNLPFYISIPKSEFSLFKNNIDTDYVNIIFDEDITNINEQSWHSQQIVKSNFWRLDLCENYLMVDSDSYFIKNFKTNDFLYGSTPYTVCHEQKELFNWSSKFGDDTLGFNPKDGFMSDRNKIMEIFNRTGKYYDFGPSPTIWSRVVWESFNTEYLLKYNLNFDDLINYCPSEFTWYGEWLLYSKVIEIMPIEPLFKVFHYSPEYQYYKQLQFSEENFKENYYGFVMSSNWGAPLKY